MQDETYKKDKTNLMKIGVVFLTLLSLFLVVKIAGEARSYRFIGSNPNVQSIINISGRAEVLAVADIGAFNFSVVEEDVSSEKAQKKATDKINKAVEYLEEAGIEEKDIKTLSYNIYPKYEYSRSICTEFSCPPQRSTIVGYEVRQTIEVKVRKTEEVGEVLSGLGALGINDISGLSFSVDNEEELKEEARTLAVEDAQREAEMLADALGVKIVRIVSFSENGGGYPAYYKESAIYGMGGGDAALPAPEIPVGENKIVSNVTISYEIR